MRRSEAAGRAAASRRGSASPRPPAGDRRARSPDGDALRARAERHVRRCRAASDEFFEAEADRVSRACRDLAKRFHRGGRMLVAGPEAGGSDAYHVSVEFVHPVLVGKRALPATAIGADAAARIRSLGRPRDVAMGITTDGNEPGVVEMLRAARADGLLTLGLAGGNGGALAADPPEHLFVVPTEDPLIVQEVQETLYHILWELVHVFFEHEGML